MNDSAEHPDYGPESVLLEHLPAVYQEPETPRSLDWQRQSAPQYDAPWLQEYLLPFEKLLLKGDGDVVGIEEQIKRLPEVIDAYETGRQFLPWLGQWASFAIRRDVPEAHTRAALSRMISLYRIRGTKEYLYRLLDLFIDARIIIVDGLPEFQIRKHSTLGVDSCLGGGAPFFFRVTLRFSAQTAGRADAQARLAAEIIELAKPAHTAYELEVVMPRMQIRVRSTIGVDTIL